jgi:hypothetical protein
MPYGEPFDRYYDNIYVPAVRGADLEPIRADSLFRSSPILGDIWRFTRQAKVLLADMSGQNPNVFYELGLAHAIGQPVVLVASSIEDVPFDLRGLRVIIYNKDNESWGADLRNNISRALTETIEDTRSAVPSIFLEAAPNRTPQEEPLMLEVKKLQDDVRAIRSSLSDSRDVKSSEPQKPGVPDVPFVAELIDALLYPKLVLPPHVTYEVAELIAGEQKIEAIKAFRRASKYGLLASKEFIEMVQRIWERAKVNRSLAR